MDSLIPECVPKSGMFETFVFETYRGVTGRVEYTEEKCEQISKILDELKQADHKLSSEPKSEGKKFDASEFFDGCESVLVCEYLNFDEEKTVGWNKPPRANFRPVEYLKGPPIPSFLPIWYEFHDMINKEKPEGWTFDKSTMPKKGSRWIIFVPNAVPIDGAFETYHGSAGRIEYNETVHNLILDAIKKRTPR